MGAMTRRWTSSASAAAGGISITVDRYEADGGAWIPGHEPRRPRGAAAQDDSWSLTLHYVHATSQKVEGAGDRNRGSSVYGVDSLRWLAALAAERADSDAKPFAAHAQGFVGPRS
jgi:hypothetical protein